MQSLAFVKPNDPILCSCAEELSHNDILSENIQNLIDAMITMAQAEQDNPNKSILVGLAAPQVGQNYRIILVDVGADGKGKVSCLKIYVNPQIIESSNTFVEHYEGCYSTGVVKGIVARPEKIKIRALTRDAQPIEETHFGYVSRIFQHEIDHLNGIRFHQRVQDLEKLHIVYEEQMPLYRNQEKWRQWEHKCTVDDLQKLKPSDNIQ